MPIFVQHARRQGKTHLERIARRVDDNLQSYVAPVSDLPDAEIEFWGNFYVANRLHARGFPFGAFMRNPRPFVDAVVFRRPMPLPEGADHYPLLPRQLEAAMRIDRHNRPRQRAISKEAP